MEDLRAPDQQARIIVDGDGIEWEVFDDHDWSTGLALDWDHLAQTEHPGLIFSSRLDRRRLWPCPRAWRGMSDGELRALVPRAKSVL